MQNILKNKKSVSTCRVIQHVYLLCNTFFLSRNTLARPSPFKTCVALHRFYLRHCTQASRVICERSGVDYVFVQVRFILHNRRGSRISVRVGAEGGGGGGQARSHILITEVYNVFYRENTGISGVTFFDSGGEGGFTNPVTHQIRYYINLCRIYETFVRKCIFVITGLELK